ncbi:phage portal protein family protein [Paenibacillus planticolens]|uniref:DUF935 family protein n=1 Tax=Paenibacillus planticolens TaxID=2654976 RepID=A0ABX1ZQP7_9BACL|nr:DUF935 family protein [Paenibacillus planticolens]NOV01355.1 DUF935 family protein [Paenibacillus planticolens]
MVAPSRIVGQIGSQLYTTFILFDKAISNPDSSNLLDYERMLDTDETIAAGIEFMILSTLIKLDRYTNEKNPGIEEFVNQCLEGMQGTFIESCEDILSALWAGYSGTEIVWKPEGSRIVLDYLATYHPRTVFFNIDPVTGRLASDEPITQYRWFSGSPVRIPKNKAIVFSHNARFGNWYGTSQLRRLRKNWLLKDPVLKMWVNAVDKFGTPLTAALVPDGDIRDPDNPTRPNGEENLISNVEYMARVLSNLQNGTGIAMAAGTGEDKSDIKSLFGGGAGMGEAFHSLVTYLNKMMFRGLLVPSLIFDEGQKSGSYALGQSHFDMYMLMLDKIFKKLKEVLLEQLVRPLVEMNYGPQKEWGDFPEREMNDDDVQKLSGIFLQLTNAGYMDSTADEDFQHVRSTVGLPERKQSAADKKAKIAEDYAHYLREPPGKGKADE